MIQYFLNAFVYLYKLKEFLMSKSFWTQTEEANDVKKGKLAAVVYSSDRSLTNVTVFGPRSVADKMGEPKPWGTPNVSLKKKGQLNEVPKGYVVEGTSYGLKEERKVLLVSGYPPTN
jgi:hypothetical protein